MAIPRILIQGWIGPSPIPEREKEWCEAMRKTNPEFEYRFFGNEILKQYGNDAYVNHMIKKGERWAFVVDRIRVLLLKEHGGIWIDPDSKPLKPLNTLKWWDSPGVDFVTAHRDPYRPGVSVSRGISLVDNTVMASVPNGRMVNRLVNLYDSRSPIRRGGDFGREIMRHSGMDVVWENPDVFYSLGPHPDAVILHDAANLASWCEHPPLKFANA